MKRAFSLLLAVMLTFGLLTISASAAGSTAQRELEAKSLFAMGLFKGYDETGTNFGLNDRVTREQALVILIRMLGLEKEALNWTGGQPYADVLDGNWAKSYIGYAKAKGLTVGIGNNQFGIGRYANMQEMTIFALRGLGYSDASDIKDFNWNTSLNFAKSKGILSSDQAVSPFTRGEAVDIIFGSMAANVKGQDYDLLSKLMNQGVVTQAQYDKAMGIFENKTNDNAMGSLQNKPSSDLADGTYTMGCMGKYFYLNTSNALEIRDTKPLQNFTVSSKSGYSYIQTENGLYLGLNSTKEGTQLTASKTPYSWLIQKQDGSIYTIRPYEKTSLVANANRESSANGTKMIVWPNPGAPRNTQITMTPATEEKAVTANFTMLNSTGKSIKELYIKDSSLYSYDREFLSNNNYKSWSNGKTINTSFSFYKDICFDFYVRFSDGSEVEATGLSFAKATSAGGKITLGTSEAKLAVGSNTVSTVKFTVKSGSTDLAAQNQKLLDRYNASVSLYNKQVDQINTMGLSSDKSLTTSMNAVTTSVNAMGKKIGSGTGNFTTAQISEYNKALDSLDKLMNELDKLIATAKADQSATRTIHVKFTNGTDTNFINFKAYTAGSSSTAQTLGKDYGEATLEFTVASAATPFTVSFTAGGTNYEMPFTFAADLKSGSTILIKFSANASGEVVWDYGN